MSITTVYTTNLTDPIRPEVVVAPIWFGWAVVSRESWSYINDRLDTIAAIGSCQTWGDYRRLNVTDEIFREAVYEQTAVEPGAEPSDEVPFAVKLGSYEDYDRDPWLQRATTDFFESLEDESFPWGLVEFADMWTTIEDENIDAVAEALEQRGFQVTKVAE